MNIGTFLAGLTSIATNHGLIDIDPGALMNKDGNLTNASDGEIRGGGDMNTFIDAFTQSGTISPGQSPGELTVMGVLPNTSTAVTQIEIGGLTPGSVHDKLTISGAATLDGTLNMTLINGFQPQVGDTFTIMTYGSMTGSFDTITGLDLGNGLIFDLQLGATSATLEVVPLQDFRSAQRQPDR